MTVSTPRPPRRHARVGMALSQREREVLTLIAEGASYDEIRSQLAISLDTVKSHVKKIFAKLDARNGPHAVAIAIGLQQIYPRDCIDAGAYSKAVDEP